MCQLVPRSAEQRQALFVVRPCLLVLPLLAGGHPEADQGDRGPVLVTHRPEEGEALLAEPQRPLGVSTIAGDHAEVVEGTGDAARCRPIRAGSPGSARGRRSPRSWSAWSRARLPAAFNAFARSIGGSPSLLRQGSGQPPAPSSTCPRTSQKRHSADARRKPISAPSWTILAPGQRRPQVVVLPFQPIQPGDLAGLALELQGRPLGERQVIPGVPQPCFLRLATRLQPFQRELPDRFEQSVARSRLLVRHRHQRLLDQGAEQIDHLAGDVPFLRPHRLGGLQRPSAGKHGEPAKERLLGWPEQLVAPGDRRPHRLLPLRQVPGAADQQRHQVIEASQQLGQAQDADPGGNQFQCQRQPVQTPANRRHDRGVFLGQRERRILLSCLPDEELHRGDRRQLSLDPAPRRR